MSSPTHDAAASSRGQKRGRDEERTLRSALPDEREKRPRRDEQLRVKTVTFVDGKSVVGPNSQVYDLLPGPSAEPSADGWPQVDVDIDWSTFATAEGWRKSLLLISVLMRNHLMEYVDAWEQITIALKAVREDPAAFLIYMELYGHVKLDKWAPVFSSGVWVASGEGPVELTAANITRYITFPSHACINFELNEGFHYLVATEKYMPTYKAMERRLPKSAMLQGEPWYTCNDVMRLVLSPGGMFRSVVDEQGNRITFTTDNPAKEDIWMEIFINDGTTHLTDETRHISLYPSRDVCQRIIDD